MLQIALIPIGEFAKSLRMREEFDTKLLRDEYLLRQRKNASYSLRAFSRDIGLQSPVVSEVFNGKRRIPKKSAEKIADKLGLTPAVKRRFINAIYDAKKFEPRFTPIPDDQYLLLEEERNYKIIAEWEHYAVFTLMDTADFESSEAWIAKRLGLGLIRTKAVLNNLIDSGIIGRTPDGELVKKVERLTTTRDVPSSALRRAHSEEMDLAKVKLESVGVEDRFYSSTTLAVDRDQLEKVKQLYRVFRDDLTSILESGTKSEVYHFNFQAFPVTNLEIKGNIK